jgi:acetolactate synthase-1/2/3 large subunit
LPVLTGAEVLAKCLSQEGIGRVFGVPGGELTPLLEAVRKEEGVEFFLTRHEQAAAHMADACYRLTGRVAACVGTVGPGAADLVPGVYPAFADGIPLLVLTAQHQSWKCYPDRASMQSLDQLSLLKAVTRWNAVVYQGERIPELVDRALRAAMRGRPGPVHLDLPVDVLFRRMEVPSTEFIPPSHRYDALQPPAGRRELVERAAELLLGAERPLVHAGGGALWSGAHEELRELVEYLSIPLTPSHVAKGILPEDHPLYLIPDSPAAVGAQASADLVLVVGCRMGDLDFFGRPPAWGEPGVQRVIQIDLDPENLGLNRQADLAILGDAKATLRLLLEEVKRRSDPVRRDLSHLKREEQEWVKENERIALGEYDGIHPMRVVYEARRFFPRSAITVVDGGNVGLWAHYLNRVYEPRTFLWAADSGHLGTGLPYAIAAKLVRPEREVYLLTGDGSLMFNVQEMETAARLGTKIYVIVLNDRSYGMIRGVQHLLYRGEYYGVDFSDVDYARVAEGMGWFGRRVTEPEGIRRALEEAREQNKPALIDVLNPRELSMLPPDLEMLGAIWMEGVEFPT